MFGGGNYTRYLKLNLNLICSIYLTGQCIVFFLGGVETVSNALILSLFELAVHEEKQEKLYQELIRTYPEETVAYDDIGKSKYLDAVIQETLRRYPALFRLIRVCVKDTDLGEFKVKKGQQVAVSVYNLHHNPTLFPEPHKFNPERFENSEIDSNLIYSFGGGPSNVSRSIFLCLKTMKIVLKFQINWSFLFQKTYRTMYGRTIRHVGAEITVDPTNQTIQSLSKWEYAETQVPKCRSLQCGRWSEIEIWKTKLIVIHGLLCTEFRRIAI